MITLSVVSPYQPWPPVWRRQRVGRERQQRDREGRQRGDESGAAHCDVKRNATGRALRDRDRLGGADRRERVEQRRVVALGPWS